MTEFTPSTDFDTMYPEVEMNAFQYQNLARKSWVGAASLKLKNSLQSIERETRFEIYKELDETVLAKVVELSKQKRDSKVTFVYETLFPEAANIVIAGYEQELFK